MADYKELIRKAIQALPENNGAARRAVYEKARAALVGQLRGLNPPLAARDITQHRLQLEDCIRQVEQEASEAVIAGLKQNEEISLASAPALPPPRPASARPTASVARPAITNGSRTGAAAAPSSGRSTAAPAPRPSTISASPRQPTATPPRSVRAAAAASAVPRLAPVPPPKPTIAAPPPRAAASGARSVARAPAVFPRAVPDPEPEEFEPETIEDIIAAAEGDAADPMDYDDQVQDEPIEDEVPEAPMFRLEQRPARKPASTANGRAPVAESRPLPAIVARAEAAKSARSTGRSAEPAPRRANGNEAPRNGSRQQPSARQQNFEPIQLPRSHGGSAAMSTIREVDLEGPSEGDAQVAIERAIATLEREARNDDDDDINGADNDVPGRSGPGRRRSNGNDKGFREPAMAADAGFARERPDNERSGGSAVTIFLLVFLVLLIVAGGGSFWAWREGFIDFDAMFGKSPTTHQAAAPAATNNAPTAAVSPAPSAQTNTESAPNTAAQSSEALSTAPATDNAPAATPTPTASAEPSAQASGAPKSEERLTQSADAAASPGGDAAKPGTDAAAAPGGSQSLLLEASQDGTTGAVPFSGTVDWSKGTDEMGQPTLIGKASIPARNLGVSVLIRKNSDPTLPASHLMEINFSVTDSFIGGAIAGLPGVLLKNEELVQGTPLVGASARVVGNSFLFALSSSPADETANKDLLTSRKWMDLAIIYATGKKAIITLEKDDKTEQMFNDVFTAWGKQVATPKPAGK